MRDRQWVCRIMTLISGANVCLCQSCYAQLSIANISQARVLQKLLEMTPKVARALPAEGAYSSI
jgi:hypothetical protein